MTSRGSSSSSDRGIVYLVESEWEGKKVIKIGRTGPNREDLENRIKTLSNGVPGTLPCLYASRVNNAPTVERNLHTIFRKLRARESSSREFFEVEPESAKVALQAYRGQDVTKWAPRPSKRDDESSRSVVQDTGKLPTATFALLRIPVGKKLRSARDNRVMCEVADADTQVLYKGKLWALSTLTTELMGTVHPLQGIRYWTYEGQTLIERRDEILERQRR